MKVNTADKMNQQKEDKSQFRCFRCKVQCSVALHYVELTNAKYHVIHVFASHLELLYRLVETHVKRDDSLVIMGHCLCVLAMGLLYRLVGTHVKRDDSLVIMGHCLCVLAMEVGTNVKRDDSLVIIDHCLCVLAMEVGIHVKRDDSLVIMGHCLCVLAMEVGTHVKRDDSHVIMGHCLCFSAMGLLYRLVGAHVKRDDSLVIMFVCSCYRKGSSSFFVRNCILLLYHRYFSYCILRSNLDLLLKPGNNWEVGKLSNGCYTSSLSFRAWTGLVGLAVGLEQSRSTVTVLSGSFIELFKAGPVSSSFAVSSSS
ncbi:hypothetical protein CHS0354_026487 [Potamilus streckersoni]|uniref:Uncharacterized protein n=1 Tax=Potamilus streckersoni TaxID=2493646 RepID=A0AAE0VGL9_9BIVA|nr:hypothetical protein CHS0354_026487 [Potamilus streckersoni]